MKGRFKFKNLKGHILALTIVVIIFALAGYFLAIQIRDFFLEQMEGDSNRIANYHMSRMTNAIAANQVIDELLQARLITAANIIVDNQDRLSNKFLRDMRKKLQVDKIYWYDSSGKIIYTADDYLGWQAEEGDPTYDFMNSDRRFLIEAIRPDEDSGVHLKYGHLKANNNEFVQVGILAENIHELNHHFSLQGIVNSLIKEKNILHVHVLDENNEIAYCNDESKREHYLLDRQEEKAIKENKPYYTRKTIENIKVYEALLPLHLDDHRVGTLVIYYSLEPTHDLIRNLSLIVFWLLVLVFGVYGFMAILIIRRNRAIKQLAFYDPVTKLLNKNYFTTFLEEELKENGETGRAILTIHCTNLNLIKLMSGQETLNRLLLERANKLRDLDLAEEHIFKNSEDSCLVYIEDYKNKDDLIRIGDKIVEAFDRITEDIESNRISKTKIGIIEIDQEMQYGEDISKYIEMTLAKLKELKQEGYIFFQDSIEEAILLDKLIEEELTEASNLGYDNEFYLEYQPLVDLKTNKIVGLEALARWKSEKLGRVSPLKFIDIAERSLLIIPLGQWIITTACRFLKEVEKMGFEDLKIAINISVVQLLQEDFINDVLNIIKTTGIRPENLEFEITESIIMDNFEIINDKLNTLKEIGVSISLDDFGTGYSSLSRLNNLRIDVVKIDKAFIDNIKEVGQDDIFINSILSIANQLGLKVVAEGVETPIQKQYLSKRDCDIIQGYIFSKPLVGDKVIELLEDNKEG